MKNMNFLNSIAFLLILTLTLTACSVREEDTPQVQKTKNGFYVNRISFNCEAPSYDQGTSRAVTYSWKIGTTLFAKFKNGSNYYQGFISLESDGYWYLASTIDVSSASGTCELYYFMESNGDYYYFNIETQCFDIYNNGKFVQHTNIAWNSSPISLTEGTAIYSTASAPYSFVQDVGWTVNATLLPMLWRMRFSGSNGTSITLPASDNDIKYVSAFNWSASTLSFSKAAKDVNLTVSSGYTPYVYGEFVNSYSKNTITVVNGSNTFYREFSSSNLPAGKSGYFTIPTTSNYNSNGWTMKQDIDPNATIQPDYLVTFTDGIVTNWKIGSSVSTFDYTVYTKTGAESLSDDELAASVYGTEPITKDLAGNIFRCNDSGWFSPNTEYYLVAVAKNSSGKRGPVLRYKFKTNSSTLPYAEISNVIAATTTKWTLDVALKYNAKSYYLAYSADVTRYNSDWHFWAYIVNDAITTGQLQTTYDWDSVQITLSSGTCNVLTVGTWGVASNGSIGNPHVAYGNASSSARRKVVKNRKGLFEKEAIPKKDLEMVMRNTKLFQINR